MRKALAIGLIECGQSLFALGVVGMMVAGLAMWLIPGWHLALALGLDGCLAMTVVGAGLVVAPFAAAQRMWIGGLWTFALQLRRSLQRQREFPARSARCAGRR